MLETIYQTAIHTPWWVYLLLVVLLKIGINASKTSVVSIKKLFIAPVVFGVMAIETLINNIALSLFVLSIFSIALLIGAVLGWLQVRKQSLRFDRNKQLIKIPGTWSVMTVIIVIFSAKYYFGYALSTDPEIVKNTYFELAFIGVTAVCTGLFIGKLICYLKRMYTEPQTDL